MRSAGSLVGVTGGFSLLLAGTKFMKRRSMDSASTSFSKARSATPDLLAWVTAPPSSSAVTSSWVTVLTTSGPVTNISDDSSTTTTKSVIDGEYPAPPAEGAMIIEICGTTPEAITLR